MAKKTSQAQRIRNYMTQQPKLTVSQVAKDLGLKYQAVYMIKRAAEKKLEKLEVGVKVGDTIGGLTLMKENDKYRWKRVATVSSDTPLPVTMEEPKGERVEDHPLYAIFRSAIEQAMFGKGERHGGARTPFLEQPWTHYAKMNGRGFLTGQAAKKLEEAATTRTGVPFEQEVFGAMVYLGMSVLEDRRREAELKR